MFTEGQILQSKHLFKYTSVDGDVYVVEKGVRGFLCKHDGILILSLLTNNPDGTQPNFFIHEDQDNKILKSFVCNAPKIFEPSLEGWHVSNAIENPDSLLHREFEMNLHYNGKPVGKCYRTDEQPEPTFHFTCKQAEVAFNSAIQTLIPKFLESKYCTNDDKENAESIVRDLIANYFLDGYHVGYLDLIGYFEFNEEAIELQS